MGSPGRTFRVFISSTFSDLEAERNALQEHVFPRLRDLCLSSGARFQAIDLRWGVSDEAAGDYQTMRICLDEIERCKQTTSTELHNLARGPLWLASAASSNSRGGIR